MRAWVLIACVVMLASGCGGDDAVETLRTTTTPPAPPGPNALLPCPDLTDFPLIPEADRTAYLTTGVPCDRPELWEMMNNQLIRKAENQNLICGYGSAPPSLLARDEAAAELLRNQLPSNIRDDMEIDIGCVAPETAGFNNEPDLGNEDANTIGREMLDIAAARGVRGAFGVTVNPDGSIFACAADEAMATETEDRATQLGIEVTVSTECLPERWTPP